MKDEITQALETMNLASKQEVPAEAAPPIVEAPTSVQTAPTPETKEEPKKEEIPQELLSPKFAAISRKERELAQKEREIAQREEKLKAREEDESLWEADPFKALEKKGLDYEKLTQRVLGGKEDKLTLVEKKLLKMEQEQKQREEMEARQQVQEKIETFKTHISDYVDSNAEKYEFIAGTQLKNLVFEVTEQYYETHGKVLSIEEACDYVENYLEKQAETIVGLKKVQAKLLNSKSKSPEKTPAPAVEQSKKETQITLTNDASTAPKSPYVSSREDEFDQALKLLKYTNIK